MIWRRDDGKGRKIKVTGIKQWLTRRETEPEVTNPVKQNWHGKRTPCMRHWVKNGMPNPEMKLKPCRRLYCRSRAVLPHGEQEPLRYSRRRIFTQSPEIAVLAERHHVRLVYPVPCGEMDCPDHGNRGIPIRRRKSPKRENSIHLFTERSGFLIPPTERIWW